MFGYIRTDTPELRVRENEYYRAVYCGLCRAQGKCTGQCSRMTLSYDAVFLALFRMAIAGENPEIKRGRCIAHPFKKRAYITQCESLSYCAYAYALLIYGKTIDDITDEKGRKRLKAKLVKPFAKAMRRKALKKNYGRLDEEITEGLKALAEIEAQRLPSVDLPADKFGDNLAAILSYGYTGNEEKILKNIGRHIGRWIYIADAVDDLEEDLEKDRFNPFICLYGKETLTEDKKQDIATSLRLELLAAEPAFDLIDFEKTPTVEGILQNILYRGMPNVADRVLCLNGKSKRQKKNKSEKSNG